jgi:2,3-bisphosphoglycerate-independent phosphoglycerate mutase
VSIPAGGIVLILLDGLADRAQPELDGRTPLEAARTPALDRLAAAGRTGVMWPLGPGRAPSSPLAHTVLFGFELSEFPGRGLLEAYGEGFEPRVGEVVCRANFVRCDARDGALWIAERPDPRDEPIAGADVDLDFEYDGIAMRFRHTGGKQGILTLTSTAGPLSHEVTDADPLRAEHPVVRVAPLAEAIDSEAAARTAAALNAWMRHSRTVLAGRELDTAIVKWAGMRRELPSFSQRTCLRGTTLSSGPLYRGLSRALGLAHDESGDDREGFSARLAAGLALIDGGKADFVHVHTKWTDSAGHRKSPARKAEVIEMLDAAIAPHLDRLLAGDLVVAVTGDHATPSDGPLYHSGEAVPLLIAGGAAGADAVTSFGETPCLAGSLGHVSGRDVMPLLLNAAERSAFLAERYTVQPCLGTPLQADVDALTVED